jgi:hypothetical protein
MPQFQMTVFFQAQAGIVPAADATTQTVAGTQPAATTGGAK